MKRIVQIVRRDGAVMDVPMTAEQAAFFLWLAELQAKTDPTITFHDIVAEWSEKLLRDDEDLSNNKN